MLSPQPTLAQAAGHAFLPLLLLLLVLLLLLLYRFFVSPNVDVVMWYGVRTHSVTARVVQ